MENSRSGNGSFNPSKMEGDLREGLAESIRSEVAGARLGDSAVMATLKARDNKNCF